MDEIILDGKTYVSSKRAAHECGYAQDYVGQLARKGLIDAKRVAGQWYIFLESLQGYKTKAENFKPEPPKYEPDPNADATLKVEGEEYISASLAAKVTQYHQDYVGQLARAGKIPSKQIGSRWYVEKNALLRHKQEKDAMLRAVQAESVGLKRPEPAASLELNPAFKPFSREENPLVYTKDDKPLFPSITQSQKENLEVVQASDLEFPQAEESSRIPIRVLRTTNSSETQRDSDIPPTISPIQVSTLAKESLRNRFSLKKTFAPAALIVLVLTVGVGFFQKEAIYAALSGHREGQTAAGGSAVDVLVAAVERVLTKELFYKRQ